MVIFHSYVSLPDGIHEKIMFGHDEFSMMVILIDEQKMFSNDGLAIMNLTNFHWVNWIYIYVPNKESDPENHYFLEEIIVFQPPIWEELY